MTLNMLRTSRCHPKLSAYAYIHGPHDFNQVPLAPPGTKIVIHKKPETRKSWGYHGELGWYVGPAINHYRCFKCFMPTTAKEVITDTVRFLPKKINFPQLHLDTYLKLAIDKIIHLLDLNLQNNNSLNLSNHFNLRKSFLQIAKLLDPSPPPPQPIQQRVLPTSLQNLLTTLKIKGQPVASLPKQSSHTPANLPFPNFPNPHHVPGKPRVINPTTHQSPPVYPPSL